MRSLRRGQVVTLKSDEVGKRRPVLIVSPVALNAGIYVSAVPFYSQNLAKYHGKPWAVPFQAGEFGLDRDCVAKADEVSHYKISELNTSSLVGEVDDVRMKAISAALCVALGIDQPLGS